MIKDISKPAKPVKKKKSPRRKPGVLVGKKNGRKT
jgi:hypothetical protein